MTVIDAIQRRHSVRRYTDQRVEDNILAALLAEVKACNSESGLNMQLVTDAPDTFNGFLAKINFSGTRDYIVLVGKESLDIEEKAGCYGERLVLKAQQLGLNTCWAAAFNKKKFAAQIGNDEKIVIIIVFGYGATQGVPRKSKPLELLCKVDGDMPDWFRSGMKAAMLAPTARNHQKFLFTLSDNAVKAESNLGTVKYHFEIGAGIDNFKWVDPL